MADASTKRAPSDPPGEAANNGTNSLEELRQLILAPEQEALESLHQRVADPKSRTADVSDVVAEAIQLRREQDGDAALRDALAPTIESSLRESVRKDPTAIADALFPVMGPAIRRSILETLRAFLESFNQVMEQSLSWQGLKWRIEAIRTGRSFSEVALLHSLVFRVEQIFLIHKKTGLPLGHAVASAVATEDPSLVSGMLTAIQDFVRDSFHTSSDQGVDRMNVGDLDVWIEHGPQASIAAVIRGIGPRELRDRLAEALEEIHREYGAELERFDGNTAPFQRANSILTQCLEARYKQDAPQPGRRYVWATAIVLAALIGGLLGWRWWQYHRWGSLVSTLRDQPGIVITSFGREHGRFAIRGLRDPLAADPVAFVTAAGLDPKAAVFHWGGYYALDDAIVAKRATAALSPPESAKLVVDNGTLEPRGSAPPAWVTDLNRRALEVPGIRAVDLSQLQIEDTVAFATARHEIMNTVVKFPIGSPEISEDDELLLRAVAPELRHLFVPPDGRPDAILEVIGHTDSSGADATNESLSQRRAEQVARQLVKLGVPQASLRVRGVGTTQPLRTEDSDENRQLNRSVTFNVPVAVSK